MISLDNINQNVINAHYAVRGPIAILAQELENKGKKIHYFNIGNPQQLGQSPLTYSREVLALLNYPSLLKKANISQMFASDSISRANKIMDKYPIGMGAYSQSAGMPFVRQAVADFITQRDNISANAKNIILIDGASKGVDLALQTLIQNSNIGIMIPTPQYPLYSADITLFGGHQVNYYLDEVNNWSLNLELLEKAYMDAKGSGVDIRAIVIINPNNPTGGVLSKKNVEMIAEFAQTHNLVIIADEVYQENIYHSQEKFYSFAKTVEEMQLSIPLFSLHSTSKGFIGECGYRGGYVEIRNISDDVKKQLLKLRSIGLCPNTSGQIMTLLMTTPPKKGDESYNLYQREKKDILDELSRKAILISQGLNSIDGIQCNTPRGAMYLFPKLEFPQTKEDQNLDPDFQFCKLLVLEEGIVTVPGSGFGQLPGTHHLRITFLPPEEDIPEILIKFEKVYTNFVNSK